MPVPSTINDLSTTAASNYPQGTDSPSTLDDVQRAHGSFIAQLRDGAHVTSATEKTTPVDADTLSINDSAASGILKKLTWANLKGNLFAGTGVRITGDFSNATIANRVMFQTSTTNGNTLIRAIPSGTGTTANFQVGNSSDPSNQSAFSFAITASEAQLSQFVNGTGTYLPMTFYTGGSERVRIGTDGAVLVGEGMSAQYPGQFQIAESTHATSRRTNLQLGSGWAIMQDTAGNGTKDFSIYGGSTPGHKLQIDTSGNVGIGTAPSAGALHVKGAGITQVTAEGNGNWGGFYAKGGTTNPSYVFFGNVTNGEKARLTNDGTSDALYVATGNAATQRLYVGSSGTLHIDPTSGLGYGAGAGGTVTQATSKATAVTLNKPTGQITMNNAALVAGASVEFDLNNTLISANDNVLVTQSGFGNQLVVVKYVSAGKAVIRVTNPTGSTLTEATVINFAIIKGAIA